MTMMEAIFMLNNLIDESDPDVRKDSVVIPLVHMLAATFYHRA
jgi:hypothetical protein